MARQSDEVFFADSYYYLALLNPGDEAHEALVDFNQSFSGKVVTTDWVLTEVADAMSASWNRKGFINLFDFLKVNESVEIVRADRGLFDQGLDLFRRRPDKDWSLTDCISFVVMEKREIHKALTGDRHFQQAGFHAVFAP